MQWATEQLDEFLALTALYRRPDPRGAAVATAQRSNLGEQDEIRASAQVVEQIIGRVIPDWRSSVPDVDNSNVNRWSQHIEAATRARAQLLRQAELAEKLGDNAPRLSASHLHPWVWESARTLWGSGHYREAVSAAARAISALTQTKVGRRDLSEHKLIRDAFQPVDPKPGGKRLRLMPDDGSDTFSSLHRGVGAYAEGLYSAIRNPNNHELLEELTEDEALEQIAAFSVLARWADSAVVISAEPEVNPLRGRSA